MVEGPDASKSEDTIQPRNEAPKKKFKEERQPTKVVIRRLPGTMTEESFLEHVSPLFEHDYFYFVQGDCRDYNFSRAYIHFISVDDVFTFTQKFDDYVFIDSSGQEFPAVVEFAPFQRIPKNRTTRKNDAACGTIEEDPEYQEFLQFLESEEQDHKQPMEHYFDLANDENEEKVTSTPLIEYLTSKKNDWLKYKEEKKEERRRREVERRKQKEETKRIKKELKEAAHKTALEKIAKLKEFKKKDNESKHAVEDAKSASSRVKGKSYQEERQRDLARRKQEEKPSGSGDMKETKNIDSDKPSTSGERESEIKVEVVKDEMKSDRGDKIDSNYKKEDKKTYRDDDKRYGPSRDKDDKKSSYAQKKHAGGYEYDRFKSNKRDSHYYEDYKTRGHSSYQKGGYAGKSGPSSKAKEQEDKPAKRYDSKRRSDDSKEVRKNQQPEKECHPLENKDADKKPPTVESKTVSERRGSLGKECGSQDKQSDACLDGEPKARDSKGDHKKDDRAERRIKNKDRPAQEIYRPGMGKFSRQRIERNKSTDSKEED